MASASDAGPAPSSSADDAPPPVLVYDGDCGFCLAWAARIVRRVGDAVDPQPYQQVAARFPQVAPGAFEQAVHLVEADGRVRRGADAIVEAFARGPGWLARLPRWLYRVPGVGAVAEAVYGVVADHRGFFSRLEGWLVGAGAAATGWVTSRRRFVQGLAVVSLIAFVSLWVQVHGLAGRGGILPAEGHVALQSEFLGDALWTTMPTLLAFGAGDAALHLVCGLGVLLALLTLLDVATAPALLGQWALYLSLVHGVVPFTFFQWDSLLVETLLLGALYAPWRLRRAPPGGDRDPPALARWLLAFLVLRFHVMSGVVKLTSEDPAWADLSALAYHYMTQPLPHAVSPLAHALPRALHEASAAAMFAVELFVPLLVFAPRRLRHAGAAAMIGLQLVIGGTGNYGFFGLLTIVLCLSLFDDHAWGWWGRRRDARRERAEARARGEPEPSTPAPAAGSVCVLPAIALAGVRRLRPAPGAQRLVVALAAVPLVAVGGLNLADALDPAGRSPPATGVEHRAGVLATLTAEDGGPLRALRVVERRLRAYSSCNAYGLFATMTTTRPEIVLSVRATADADWADLPFRWKVVDPAATPGWCQPHMPRLDWQMWFEALSWERHHQVAAEWTPSPWFRGFLMGLLEARADVLALLPDGALDGPPHALRVGLFDYRFATAEDRARTGDVWVREQLFPRWLTVDRRD